MPKKERYLFCLTHEHEDGTDGYLFCAKADHPDDILDLGDLEIAAQLGVDVCVMLPCDDKVLVAHIAADRGCPCWDKLPEVRWGDDDASLDQCHGDPRAKLPK